MMKIAILFILLPFVVAVSGCNTCCQPPPPPCCTVAKTTSYHVTYEADPYRVYYIGPAYPYKLMYEEEGTPWF